MKAVWDFGEYRRMTVHPLMFTATNITGPLIEQLLEPVPLRADLEGSS
jgi:hypothetical protein